MRRENTFKIDYSQFTVKPTLEKLFGFCRSVLGLRREDIKRLQCHRGGSCAFVKVSTLALAQSIVDEHDGKHEVDCGDGKKLKLRITLEDGSVEVRVHDLPEDVSEEKVVHFLSGFGEVVSINELTWGESDEALGIPLGVWSVRMLVKRNIDSWVTIDGEQAFVIYKGQLQTCRHCKEQAHTGISCVQNKKLVFQKSYANVAKQSGQANRSSTGQQPKRSAGPKQQNKSVGQNTTAQPPSSSATFAELPKSSSQAQSTGPVAHTSTQLAAGAAPSRSQTAKATNSPTSLLTPPQAVVCLDDVAIFKKPEYALRSQGKAGNGNESDESSTSTSSRRSRARPVGKKPRRDDGSDAMEEDPPQ